MPIIVQLLIGLGLSALIAVPAYFRKSLTLDGMVCAMVIGSALFGMGGWPFFVILIAFFLSSSLLSKVLPSPAMPSPGIVVKGNCRDYTQVIANGGVAFGFALAYFIHPSDLAFVGFATAFAAANADTWASEIGPRSRESPVFLIKRTPVTKGLSGGVSGLGFAASAAGALFIAIIALAGWYAGHGFTWTSLIYGLTIVAGGFLGSVIDSLIGELFQAKYLKPDGKTITERRFEDHGENRLITGFHAITNNVVNFVSALMAAILSSLVLLIV